MADTFHLEIATPERLFVGEDVTEAEVPGKNGYMGILPGHAPLVSALEPGILRYTVRGQRHAVVVDGGFVEVGPESVRVLADSAELPDSIQTDRARQALERANEDMKNAQDPAQAEAAVRAMKQAQARIDAAESAGRTQ